MTTLSIRVGSTHPSVNSVSKRLLDIAGSTIGLVILAVVFVPIAIAIYLDNPGPILYAQKRCVIYGKPFKISKFRTMIVKAEKLQSLVQNEANGPIFKNRNDPRVTRLGRFLRRTSLDELPQFWNVLMGEMSLVGTRPPTLDEVEHYSKHHWRRLDVKPGITGEWQVRGRSTVKDFEKVVELDLRYQRRWSFWYDLAIICQTIYVVIREVGAC
ncbi:sugar transferase [Microseira wollei]|uniref:Undecaprenyl-phosphate galactose phosphotransferase n=1 Tax=Microseira wollei NIES-4236 TaxID=2530354 RepID=A0AAV3X5Z4_9CYAN|nr:sugar transferase [Microseira wollei]GET36011.1 undecaprenyl-phosphate galactose phosphotransferase [Microseira wollei NIES-4236]